METNIDNGEWFSGKSTGSIKQNESSFCVSFGKDSKYFPIIDNSIEAAREAAKKWQYEESIRNGTIMNRMRIIRKDNEDPYLEVQLYDDVMMKCEIQHRNIVEKFIWTAHPNKDGSMDVKCRSNNRTGPRFIKFHELIYPNYRIIHVNGDKLDNRICNLKETNRQMLHTY